MRQYFIKMVYLVVLACITTHVFAATEVPISIQNFINQLEQEKAELQGGAIAILHRGTVVYKTTFGHRQGDLGPINNKTLFPLASVSKVVTAAALSLMVERGELNLREKFKLPSLQNPVTFTQLLSHTTGYNYSGNPEIEKGLSREHIFTVLKKQKPKCQPERCYRYSNFIFGMVEEALNHKKSSLQQAIDTMNRELRTEEIKILPLASYENIAYPHSEEEIDGVKVIKSLPFPPYYPKASPAGAGVFASIDGMIEVYRLKFGYRPDLISGKTLKVMNAIQKATRNNAISNDFNWPVERSKIDTYCALGVKVFKIKGQPDKDMFFHPGWIGGINSFIGHVPSSEMGIIILLNQSSKFPVQKGVEFWNVLATEKRQQDKMAFN